MPSSPGESSSNGRPVAKARGVDPVMSVPFVQGSLFQQQTPVGNMEPMSVMMAQMNQMMQTMSTFQSEVSNRLAVLERRENLQQTVLTGVENPQSFGESYGSGQGGSFNRLGSPIRERHSNRDEVDVFSKSEKWLPNPPTPDTKSWTTREQEIEGFYSYIQALRSWSMLASDRLANEISQAMSWPEEIITSTLTPGQQARSAKLFALLRTAFATHPRVDALIRAFEAGAPIHNSPMKPFGSCGFELLRVLGLEFSLRTRTEAICLRSEVMKKDFRIDARGTHVVSDLLRAMAVETSRYDKLISTLPPTVPRTDLLLNESDQALILIRNLPADARQYVLLHAQDDGLTALREAGLKYERQQRLYSELGAVAGKLRQVQEGESGAESDDEGAVDAIGTGDRSKRCTKCGKRHETSKCRTDMTNITCFKCGKKGHIGANCKVKSAKSSDGKSSKDSGKSSGKASQDGKPSSKGSGKGKKGKMFEVTEGDGEQDGDETAGGADQVTMVLTGPCEMECTFEILEVVAVDFAFEHFQNSSCDDFVFKPKPETMSFWNHRVSWESLRTLGTVFAVFMHIIACFMFCCGIQMVFRDVAVDRKQLCCSHLVTVVDWLDECEGDGLLDCGCTRKHWADPWMGFRSKAHGTDLHGMRLLMDCTLDETWHETPVSLEYCESPLKGKRLLSEVPSSDVGMCLHASDRVCAVDCVADLLSHDMVKVGSCCSCVVCAVDCVADLLPHSIARCTCDEICGCGVCLKNCLADLWSHDTTGCACDENSAEVHNHHCLVSDPLSPLLNSTLQEETDWWLIDSGASVSVISERNVRNYKIVSREPYVSSAGFFAANGSPVKMSERVKLEVTLQTVRNGETQNTRVLIACLVGDTKSNILSTGSLVKNGWAIQMSSEEFSMKHSSGLECQLIEWGGCPWVSCKGVSGVSQLSSGELNVVRYGLQPDELHRARGHMPYDPSCKHCVAAKSVGQHRRKNQDSEGGIIMELHSDFFFIGKEKFLVVADLSSHMFGALWMSPNSDVNHRNLSYWLKEFGCMDGNPKGVLHVYTDDEVAVGAVFQDAKLDKPVKVTRAAPQSPETNGLAERCVRTLKESCCFENGLAN